MASVKRSWISSGSSPRGSRASMSTAAGSRMGRLDIARAVEFGALDQIASVREAQVEQAVGGDVSLDVHAISVEAHPVPDLKNQAGRERATPASTLPTVCCAASPTITAVKGAPQRERFRPQSSEAQADENDRHQRDETNHEPDQPRGAGSMRWANRGWSIRPRLRASAQPRIATRPAVATRTGRSTPNSSRRHT